MIGEPSLRDGSEAARPSPQFDPHTPNDHACWIVDGLLAFDAEHLVVHGQTRCDGRPARPPLGGRTWASVGGGLPLIGSSSTWPSLRGLGTMLYAVLVHAGIWDASVIFRTSDGGSTWTSTAPGLNLGWDALVIDPSNPAVMFGKWAP